MSKKLTKSQQELYLEVASEAEAALRRRLGEPLEIKAVPGLQGRVQLQLVSDRLNELTEWKKQEFLWNILREELKEKAVRVSFILGYGTNEEVYNPLEAY